MTLQGGLDTLSFADVALLLGRRRLTGKLDVRSSGIDARLYFVNGRVVGMKQRGRPTDTHGAPLSCLAAACSRLLKADHGSFEFRPGMPDVGRDRVNVEVRTLLNDARAHLEAWRDLELSIPSLDMRLPDCRCFNPVRRRGCIHRHPELTLKAPGGPP